MASSRWWHQVFIASSIVATIDEKERGLRGEAFEVNLIELNGCILQSGIELISYTGIS